MNVPSAAAVVAASMIGAGVYTTSGFTLGDLGQPHLVMLVWLIGGVIAVCGAICYGALAKRFTESGGEYLFLSRAIHPAAGMTAGWVSILAGFAGAMAFAASTFESIAREAAGEWVSGVPDHWIAIALVLVAAMVHSFGLQLGTTIQNWVVVAKLVLIAIFLAISFWTISTWKGFPEISPEPVRLSQMSQSEASASPELSAWQFALVFANALTWVSLSYSGFNAAVYLTDEIEQPRRNVPRAMLWGTLAVTVLYLLLNCVFVYAPPPEEILGQKNVATIAAQSIGAQVESRGLSWGKHIAPLVRLAILIGLATSVLALMQTGPRVYQKMAMDGLLPQWLRGRAEKAELSVSDNRGAWTAIWAQAVLGIVVICVASLREQLDYLGFTLSICAALCGSLVFVFPRRGEDSDRVWGYPIVPLIYVMGTLGIATLTAIRVPAQAMVGLGTLGVGIVVYWLSRDLWASRVT